MWPEDDLNQRPKHVVSLNKTTKQVVLWPTYLISVFFLYTYKHNGDGPSKA